MKAEPKNTNTDMKLELETTPQEFVATNSNPVIKEYYGLSPYASIEVLKNGRFIVSNKVTNCEHYGFTNYAEAKEQREVLAQKYKTITRGY
tara:strand:+ start:84 stop:356 length:273 start_codon:yes stop_codon:yes gene_type:complete